MGGFGVGHEGTASMMFHSAPWSGTQLRRGRRRSRDLDRDTVQPTRCAFTGSAASERGVITGKARPHGWGTLRLASLPLCLTVVFLQASQHFSK
jgi:hypothetical protein